MENNIDVFTSTVCTRVFECEENGRVFDLEVEIGRPIQDFVHEGGTDWRCPVRSRAEGKEIVRSVFGVDSYQALSLAMSGMFFLMVKRLIDIKQVKVSHLGEVIDINKEIENFTGKA